MPVYVYECPKCGETYEFEHGINEQPPRKLCKECRGRLKKVFVPVGVVFKGSGFYQTDSRKKENDARAKYEKMDKPEIPQPGSIDKKVEKMKKGKKSS